MDDLDGLLELADALDEDKPANAASNHADKQPCIAAGGQHADSGDLLLCLADTCTEDEPAGGCKGPKPALNRVGKSLSPQVAQHAASQKTPAVVDAAAARVAFTAAGKGRSTAVQMSSSKAFSAVGKGSSSSSMHFGHASSGNAGVGGGIAAASQQQQQRQQQQQEQQQQQHKAQAKPPAECQHFVEKLTGLKIKLLRASGIVLRERYKHMTYVPVSKARYYAAAAGSAWVVVGVLVAKSIGSTSQGAPYSRWKLADLAGGDAWVSLFGDAHKDHYAQAEGSIMAFYQPRFSSKGPAGSSSSSGSGLAVSQSQQVEHLATSAGWGFCRGTTKAGSRCSNAVDTTVSHYCQYHALQQAKTLKAPVKAAAAAAAAAGGRSLVQQGQQGPAGPGLMAPAPSNGKVFDARSTTWTTTSSSNTSRQQQQQQPNGPNYTTTGSLFGSSPGSGAGGSSGTCGSGSRCRSGSGCSPCGVGQKRQLLGDAAAAAACGQVAANCAAEAERRRQAEQAELRETLRRRLLQQKKSGQQQQQQQLRSLPPLSCSRHQAARTTSTAVRPSSGGFSLGAVVAAVDADKQRQEEQQQQQWVQPLVQQRPEQWQQASTTAAAAAAGEEDIDDDLDAEIDELFDDSADDALHITDANSSQGEQAAAQPVHIAAAAAAGRPAVRAPAASAGSRTAIHSSGASSKIQQRLRADLGLGPKPQKAGSKGPSLGSKPRAATARASSSSGGSGSAQQHVSRIGNVGAGQKQQLGPARASAAAIAKPAAGAVASDFRAAFGRVLQRSDINKPDAKLLSAAADAAHAGMFAKLLDQYEQKDQLAQQLEGITKLQVTAFECRTCKALTEKRHASCSGHDVIAVRVMKRWWLCEACGWKVTTLREVMPSKRCPKCRDPGVLFRATSAYNEPKPLLLNPEAAANPLASREGMLPRGREHAFCLQDSL